MHREKEFDEEFLSAVPAGFPSPAEDYMEKRLDLNELLITHPAATFFLRVSGDSMLQAGIHSGDIIVVDRALEPKSGDVVVAVLQGEMTVKRFHRCGNRIRLLPEKPEYRNLDVSENFDFVLWGVVTYVIHPIQSA